MEFDPEWIPRNVEYYGARTSHGSTLSRMVDAWVLAHLDGPRSWSLLTQALESDVKDTQGGTTSEGIHLGAMAGTVDLVQRCYAGIEVREQHLWLNPSLAEELRGLRIRVRFQAQIIELDITHDLVRVRAVSPRLKPSACSWTRRWSPWRRTRRLRSSSKASRFTGMRPEATGRLKPAET